MLVGYIHLTPINFKTVFCFLFNSSFAETTLNHCVQHYSNGFFVYLTENINNFINNNTAIKFILFFQAIMS